MIWKILLGIGLFGIVACVVFAAISLRGFYGADYHSNDEDLAFGGLLLSILGLVVSVLITGLAAIFVLKNSKKEFE